MSMPQLKLREYPSDTPKFQRGDSMCHFVTPVYWGAEKVLGNVCQVANQTGVYPSFNNMKRLGVFLLPPCMGC